jgi:MHS family proline/betaine transporter-like MFS transporter
MSSAITHTDVQANANVHAAAAAAAATVPASDTSSFSSENSSSCKTLSSLDKPKGEVRADVWQTVAGLAGSALEWYDFAIYGSLGDVIGQVFFPPQAGNFATIESFTVFGAAFLMRPFGGLVMGYIGDVYGRDKALILSIFLMAAPTFLMGCLPSYQTAGGWAIALLIFVRLLQGLSVGGQLMSALVFTVENHDRRLSGLYGSLVLCAANTGTLMGSVISFLLRAYLSPEQLKSWGWRVPFLAGVVVSLSGFYLRSHSKRHQHGDESNHQPAHALESRSVDGNDAPAPSISGAKTTKTLHPLRLACARENRRKLISAALVPMLWAGGFYLGFVWLALFMQKLSDHPLPSAFGVNSLSLLLSMVFFFPVAGYASDRLGRKRVMLVGGYVDFVVQVNIPARCHDLDTNSSDDVAV